MAEVIIMPKLGINMDEGQLAKWHKAVGDSVIKGEELFEINTDKTTMTVEATCEGVLLAKLLEEGDFAPVFTPIGVVGAPGEDYAADLAAAQGKVPAFDAAPNTAEPTKASRPETIASPTSSLSIKDLKLSPKARKFVQDEGIAPASLTGVQGSGYQGGITAQDIKASPLAQKISTAAGVDVALISGSGAGGKVMKADVVAALSVDARDGERKIFSVKPYEGIRKIIGDKLSQSKISAPHVYFTESVDATNLTAIRKQLNDMADVKIAVSDLLTMTIAKAIKKYPEINASLINGNIIVYKSINIGTAVAGDNGLIVPVIKNVQEKSLTDVARESQGLVSRAKEGRLMPEEYSGGTFTISNLGMFGIENFTAVINGDEAAILAVSSVRKKAAVIPDGDGKDAIVVRPMMNIQLSVDHRLIDGLLAAQFIGYVKQLLENPIQIFI